MPERLSEWEYIVTAYAEPAAGPGWANSLVYVVIGDKQTGKTREECLQPDEQTDAMRTLYGIAAQVAAIYKEEAEACLTTSP